MLIKHQSFPLALGLLAALFSEVPAGAQTFQRTIHPRDRIVSFVDDHRTLRRIGNRHPLARPQFDAGRAESNARMEHMILALQPDAAQQDALTALLAAQQDPSSPQYQQWMTPESFGQMFGASDRDVEQIVSWLQGHGFDVEPVSPDHRTVVFSGDAAQVEAAFHTEIHVYDVGGEIHFASASDPEIPLALASVVHGVVSLHSFQSKPQRVPAYTGGSSHYLAPADFATIYNLGPLYTSSIDGTGQSVAIVGRTNLKLSDVQKFRSLMGLPAKDPTIILNGPDPGIVSSGELGEAILDVEWAGAVAKNATIQFVVSASTNSTDGVDLSAQYIVSHNLAPVLSVSFGSCEAAMGASENQFWNALWQQAASQGISVFVASGDSGAAGCDAGGSSAGHSAGVNGLCSSPYSTCVGGTQFADTGNPGLYWSTTTNPSNYGSALSYIPETAWNESGSVSGGSGLWATGGGASILHAKPSWQTGAGVPADNHRFVPDVSLSASGHDGYIIYMSGQLAAEGGTSAASPSFAGLMALAVQKAGARQGNANPAFYGLAAQQGNNGAAVFHDITSGSNSVPGQAGFNAGAGYDRATGLGSVDAAAMVNNWTSGLTPTPDFQLNPSASSAKVIVGGSKALSASVTISGGFSSSVALSASGLPTGLTAGFSPASIASPGSGSTTLTLSAAAQMPTGIYTVTITGTGGGLSRTLPLAVTVSPTCSYALNASQASAAAAGGSNSVAVITTDGCTWTAASNAAWISIAGATGSTVNYSVAANTTATQRSGTMTIAGLTFTVTQAAAVFRLDPSSANVSAAAGTGTATLSAPSPASAWTAVSNAGWIIITTGASGTGSKSIGYSYTANTSSARTGTMTIAGLAFTVTQAASAPAFSLNPTSASVSATGGTGTFALTASPSTATWTAASNASWISVTTGASGTGGKSIGYSYAANTSSARSGTITIAGLTFTVNQAAFSGFRLDPGSATAGASAGTGSVSLIAPSTASTWTAVSNANWLSITNAGLRTGSKAISYSFTANTSNAPRTGTLTIAGLTFTLTQASAAVCSYGLATGPVTPSPAGMLAAINVRAGAGCAWTASSTLPWFSIASGASGTGNGTVVFLLAPNNGPTRSGTVVIAGIVVTVTEGPSTGTQALKIKIHGH